MVTTRASFGGACVAVIAAVLLTAGCTADSSDDKPSGSSAESTASSAPSAAVSGSGGTTPSGSVSARTSRPARTGSLSVVPTRSQTTKPPVALRSQATFGGGVTARLVSFTPAKVTDSGPGALVGRAATAFTVEFRNRSSKALSLNTVEVTAMYGDKLAASPVNQNVKSAKGRLEPNSTGRGVYTFAIPVADLDDVQVAVSLDPRRPTVVFAGSVR